MYNSDYVLIYKDELLDWTFQEAGAWYLWTFLRLKAATADSIQRIGSSNTIGSVKFGQFLTSKRYLSEQLHMSSRRIEYLLGCFVQAQCIHVQEDSNSILITIRNFERFCPPVSYVPFTSWILREDVNRTTETDAHSEDSNSEVAQSPTTIPIISPIEAQVQQQVMHQVSQQVTQKVPETSSQAQAATPQNSPESPIIIEEDNKKENNIPTTASYARESEEEFFERLRNSPAELEVIRTELKLKTIDEVLQQLNVFQIFISGKNEHHANYGHFASHFMSWHRKYTASKAYKKSAPKQGSGQPPRYEKPRKWRDNLGISSNAVTIEDYEEPI